MIFRCLKCALLLFILLPSTAQAQFEDLQELEIKPHDPFYQYNHSQGSCLRRSSAWTYGPSGDSIPSGKPWKTTYNAEGFPMITTTPDGRALLKRRYQNGRIKEIKKANPYNDVLDQFVMEYDKDGRLTSLTRYAVETDGQREKSLSKSYVYSERDHQKDSVIVTTTFGRRVIHRTYDENERLESFAISSRGEIMDSGQMEYADGELKRYSIIRHYESGNITEEYTCKDGLLAEVRFAKDSKVFRRISYQYTKEGHISHIRESVDRARKQYFSYED